MLDQVEKLDFILSIIFTVLAFFVLIVTIVIFIYFSRKKIFKQEIELQKEMLNQIINAREQERIRISRDLHDDVSSKLTAISMHVYLLGQNDINQHSRIEMSSDIFNACQQLIESTRRISHNLMPPVLDNLGLDFAIKDLCQEYNKTNSLNITYKNKHGQDFFAELIKEYQIHLYRIIQELITNSIKHGKASEIILNFNCSDDVKKLIYLDNGIGMPSEEMYTPKGLGIKNIILRSDILQAKISFDTKKGNGFCFTLTL